uniref:Uncharacterized protein n=1 Tax=Anguilla anguilla TaxID=7936 RepID=A0A0E9XPX6_ANGAN
MTRRTIPLPLVIKYSVLPTDWEFCNFLCEPLMTRKCFRFVWSRAKFLRRVCPEHFLQSLVQSHRLRPNSLLA